MNKAALYVFLGLVAAGCTGEPSSDASKTRTEIYMPNATNREVRELRLRDEVLTYTVVDGVAVIDGDIVMGEVDEFESKLLAAGSWHGIAKNSGEWQMPVQFKFHSEVPSSVKTAVYAAISELEAETSGILTFSECDSATTPNCNGSRIKFRHHDAGCSSPLGRQTLPVVNTINLDWWCDSDTVLEKGRIRHEILHSMGYNHEQNRCDRDTFVTINDANILSGEKHNFNMKCGNNWTDISSYNFGSIMHYSSTAFVIPGAGTTIDATPPYAAFQNVMGYRGPISAGDLVMIEAKYGITTFGNGVSCTANLECTSGNCVPTGWWVGAAKKCSAAACDLDDWDAQNFDNGSCDNGCLLHNTDLCPSGMDCASGGDGSGVCVDACDDDSDCSGTHPYCVYADAAKVAKLCNKANCSPCEYDSTPSNLTCESAFADGTSGDCGGGSTCFDAQCISHCSVDGDCAGGETCEWANSSRTTRYCNATNCTSCQYDTDPTDAVCSNNLASGSICNSIDECDGAGQCVCIQTPNGMSCTSDSECCSSHCEDMNAQGTLKQCNRVSCTGEYDLDPHNLICDNGSF